MFTRYWRTYPWFLQLFLFVMMVLIFQGLAAALIYVLPKFTGVSFKDISNVNLKSPASAIRSLLYVQGIRHACMFMIPCLVFAYLTHPRPAAYLGLQPPKNKLHFLLVPLLMIGLMLLVLYGEQFVMTHVKLPADVQRAQAAVTEQNQMLLSLKGTGDLLLLLLVLAVLPAAGEELMFRGIFMRFARRIGRNMLIPIVIAAVFFTLVHDNPIGLPFIFLSGMVLGFIYWLTGSLWLSILGHFLFNGLQIAAAFWSAGQPAAATAGDALPLWMLLTGIVLFAGAGYALVRTRTPLPDDWTDDYRGEQRDESSSSSPFSLF